MSISKKDWEELEAAVRDVGRRTSEIRREQRKLEELIKAGQRSGTHSVGVSKDGFDEVEDYYLIDEE